MNSTQCVSKISEELLHQIVEIASKSGMSVNDLADNLYNYYNSKENEQTAPIVSAYGSYWDSFVS